MLFSGFPCRFFRSQTRCFLGGETGCFLCCCLLGCRSGSGLCSQLFKALLFLLLADAFCFLHLSLKHKSLFRRKLIPSYFVSKRGREHGEYHADCKANCRCLAKKLFRLFHGFCCKSIGVYLYLLQLTPFIMKLCHDPCDRSLLLCGSVLSKLSRRTHAAQNGAITLR